ncbi:MAG TPA: tetratricopeptide repeat protein, partial [Geobacteraceae bacterium]
GGGRSEYWGGSFGATLLTMVPVLVRYLGMVVWPRHLSPAYAQPFKESADAAVLLSTLVLLAVIASGIWLFRRNRPLASWLGVAGITILPVAQLVPLVTLMNDRYLYFPLLGFAALMGGGVTCLADAIAPWGRRGAVAVVLLLFLALPWLTHRQAKVWQDATTLWRHAVAVEPECGLAWLGYGHALMTDGYIPQALSATLRAYELYPQDEDTLLNLGLLYKRLQVPREGRPYLLALVGQNPRNFGGWFALGENYLLTGEKAAAEDALRRALALRPDEPAVAARLAELARGAGSKRN